MRASHPTDATPTRGDSMQNPMIQNLVQFTHLEKTYGYLPGMSEATVAALFGLDEATYREIQDRFDENAPGGARIPRRPFACRARRSVALPSRGDRARRRRQLHRRSAVVAGDSAPPARVAATAGRDPH